MAAAPPDAVPPAAAPVSFAEPTAPAEVAVDLVVEQPDVAPTRTDGRVCQLTYTSFDGRGTSRPRAGGGWQVKEARGEVTDAEQELMRAWVSTRLDLVQPLPPFPTPDDIARTPRRLLYAPVADKRAGYWHTVQAGADASGRPGNVFAHVVLEPNPDEADKTSRPIDRWRSADWLVPYGPDAVSAAELETDGAPRPSGAVSREAVVDFLLDPDMWRFGVLSALLDAVSAAMAGGKPVVLGVADSDRAAQWIAAVSYLMSPGTARTLSWCTYDRRQSLDEALEKKVQLIAVPIGDLPEKSEDPRYVLIGEDEDIEQGELAHGEPGQDWVPAVPHRTARGTSIAPTAWSALAQTVLLDHDTAIAALTRLDEVAAKIGDVGLTPGWPLAVVLASNPDLIDGLNEATRVLAEDSPNRVKEHPELLDHVLSAIGPALGESTEDVWQELLSVTADGPAGTLREELVFNEFIRRAVGDSDWLSQDRPRYPGEIAREPGWASEDVHSAVYLAVHGLLKRSQDPARTPQEGWPLGLSALRLLDLLTHTGVVNDDISEELFLLLESAVIPTLLAGDHSAQFVGEAGPIGRIAREDYLWELLDQNRALRSRPLGQRLQLSVVDWLLEDGWNPLTLAELEADPTRAETPECMLVAERVFLIAAKKYKDPAGWQRVGADRAAAAWRALMEAKSGEPLTDISIVLEGALAEAPVLKLRLAKAFPGMIPARAFVRPVIRAPWNAAGMAEAINALANGQLGSGDSVLWTNWGPDTDYFDQMTVAWAALRGCRDWSTASYELFHKHGRTALHNFTAINPTPMAVDLQPNLVVAFIALQALPVPAGYPPQPQPMPLPVMDALHELFLISAAAEHGELVAEALATLCRNRVLDISWLVANAILAHPEAPRIVGANQGDLPYSLVAHPAGGDRVSVLGLAARQAIGHPDYYGPNDEAGVMDALGYELERRRVPDVEKALRSYKGFAANWIAERYGKSDSSRFKMFKGLRG